MFITAFTRVRHLSMFIARLHLSCSLCYDMSAVSSKASCPQCDVVLPLSISSIILFSSGHPLAAYILLLYLPITYIFSSTVLFRSLFQSNPALLFLVLKLFLFSLTLCNTPSFIAIKAFICTSQSYSRKIGTDICGWDYGIQAAS